MLPFVYCAISSGARAGELLGLEWKDVNLAKGFALIHKSKNTDGRKLYLRGQALDYLKAYGKVRDLHSPGVFLLNSGAPLTHSQVRQAVSRCLQESRHPGFSVPRSTALLRSACWRNGASCSKFSKC